MFQCPMCGSRMIKASRKHTLWEIMTLRYTDDAGNYVEEDAGDFGDSVEMGPWTARTCEHCDAALPDLPAPQWWSVLLRYPDYLDSDSGETYYSFREAQDMHEAIRLVRADCMADNTDAEGDCFITSPDDLAVMLVLEGAHPERKAYWGEAR